MVDRTAKSCNGQPADDATRSQAVASRLPGALVGVTMNEPTPYLPRLPCSTSCLAGAADPGGRQHDQRFAADVHGPHWKRSMMPQFNLSGHPGVILNCSE